MFTLNRFESNLLDILHAMLDDQSPGMVMAKILQPTRYPGCLSEPAVRVIERSLAKGMTAWLARAGGWQRDRFLRQATASTGTLWQRTPPEQLGFSFTKRTLQFLVWITRGQLLETKIGSYTGLYELSLGDQLVVFRMLAWLRLTPVGELWFSDPRFTQLPLVALHFPHEINCQRWQVPDFAPWLGSAAATAVLESLQNQLAQVWTVVEQGKGWITDAARMQRLGQMQREVLTAYLDALDTAGRRDLARFLLASLQRVVGTDEDPQVVAGYWVRNLQVGGMRLADRTQVYHSASTFLAVALRLRKWTDQSRQTGYFDEGYAAAQLWLADWERYDGDRVTLRALAMVRRLTADLTS